ncbi:type III effector protein [Ralstonia syzygii]|uniref:Type III effector protein n=1 Tax=Ralstonia syzygii TaxID=28097 RepID=A0ABX7ZK22_9RALS|nr:type III effector protein [Ralstonia syzygii]QUP55307.1 type III effector protein [Ralstonia syzygii]
MPLTKINPSAGADATLPASPVPEVEASRNHCALARSRTAQFSALAKAGPRGAAGGPAFHLRAKLRQAAYQVGKDAVHYRNVQNRLNAQMKQLRPETGFQDQLHFSDASLAEVESILRHIAVSPALLSTSRSKSAVTALFTKTFLMPLLDGGQLRLHEFRSGGRAQEDEEDPHRHRWNLKTEHLKGAYVQQVHEETHADAPGARLYQKHQLEATPKDKTERRFTHLGEVHVRQSATKLYSEEQRPHDFPLAETHSVADLSRHAGMTLTLARTGKAVYADSIAYNAGTEILTTAPLGRAPDEQAFIERLHRSIAIIQLVQLQRALEAYLRGKAPASLTAGEQRHLEDAKAPNYFETSLLPALATLDLAKAAGQASDEFSPETVAYLDCALDRIRSTSLRQIIADNDAHLQAGHFCAELSNFEQLKSLIRTTE